MIKTHRELEQALRRTLDEKLYEQARPQVELEERRALARQATSRRAWMAFRLVTVLSVTGLLSHEHTGPAIRYAFTFIGSTWPELLPLALIIGAIYLRAALVRINRDEAR